LAAKQFQNVRGMPDILPEQAAAYDYVISTFGRLAGQAGYRRIETPILEDSAVFTRGVGDATDIVSKEMYVFEDRSHNQLALRPEPTAGISRAFIQHGMNSWPQPVKFWVTGPMFRYDRPQAGRQRQFYQLGVELYGESAPSADAEVILLQSRLYRALGLTQLSLQINSLGDAECRPKYRKALIEYLRDHEHQLCEQCRERLDKNPLRILDCKEPNCRAVVAGAPQMLNFLCKACHAHFAGVLEYLDELDLSYELNHSLVRGLDYYTRTVWEFYGEREGAQSAVAGGGRYDELVAVLGGQPTPAVGFGSGIERILLELEAAGASPAEAPAAAVFVASLGEPARMAAFRLTQGLLGAGVAASSAVDKNGIQSQLSRADRLGAVYAVIIGQKEVMDQTVILRDMRTGAQEMVSEGKIVAELQRRLKS
jgi:histidyl-tRNA synthetase